jgi:hypothetical protein
VPPTRTGAASLIIDLALRRLVAASLTRAIHSHSGTQGRRLTMP